MEANQKKQASKQRRYTQEFKDGAVRLVLEQGKRVVDVGRDLGVHQSVIGLWVRQAKIEQGKGPAGALTASERDEMTRMRKEIRELRMERELLKKWAAFFARENA